MRMKQLAYAISILGIAGVANVYAADEAQKVEKIEITGSSIKRIQKEGALPVQVVTKDEIARTGATSTEELLATISAISSAGATVNATGAGTSTYGLSSISLRGLEAARTLVLVNGRRIAAFAGGGGATVNVNSIPVAAIERIEVLKDGASGVYGSDAVAGVVNFILTKNYQGLEIGATSGAPTRSGGGDNNKVNIVAGFGSLDTDGYNVTAAATYEKQDTLRASDRDFSKTGNKPPFFTNSATGQGNIEGVWIEGVGRSATLWGTSPASGYGNPLAATNACESQSMFLAGNTSKGGKYCQYDSAPAVGLIPKSELASFTGNFNFKLTDNATLFGDLLYSQSKITQSYQANPLRASFLETDSAFNGSGVDAALLLKPSNPNYAKAAAYLQSIGRGNLVGQTLAVTSRTLGFGGRSDFSKNEQTRGVLGVKGTFGATDYEFALSSNESKGASKALAGYFSQVQYAKIINDTNSWNPWAADGLGDPALLAKLQASAYTGDTLKAKSKSTVADGKIGGELFSLGDGTVAYAAGFQARKEDYTTSPSAALGSGDIAGLGGSVPPVDKSRKVTAFFGELNVPILSTLEGTLAVRNDHYDDVGGSTNYKASFRFQPVKSFLVRGSVGTGFRAPTLTDLWQPQSLGTSEQFTDPGTGAQDIQVNALTGGNPNLKPEKSDQYSFGFVFAPSANFNASVDFFHIKVKEILATPSAQEIVSRFRAGDAAYAGLVKVDANNDVTSIIQLTQNTGEAKVNGVDLDLNFNQRFGPGRLDVNLSGTYMSKYDQTSPGGQISHKVGTIVDETGAPVLGAQNGGVILRWKHTLAANWTQGAWSGGIAQNFYLGYQDGHDLNDDPHRVPSQALYDVNLSYKGIKNLKLGVGVRNVFDKEPPLFIPVSNQFQYGYDVTQYDPRARFAYVSASYKFF
ncbi:TonB-dependent receptor [Chitinimonas naiadis]